MKKFLNFLIVIFIFLFIVLFALTPKKYTLVTMDGLKLWIAVILPSLFPYMVMTGILSAKLNIGKLSKNLSPVSNKLFGTGGASVYVFLVSIISGYPVGAAVTADLYDKGLISSDEATKISTFCTTSGPIFILGSVGQIMLKSKLCGLIIYVSHVTACIITGIIFKNLKSNNNALPVLQKKESGMTNSVLSILTVGGYITIAYLFTEMLLDIKVLTPIIFIFSKIFGSSEVGFGVTAGIIETTRGAKILTLNPNFLTIPLITALISFGGISIILQCLNFYKKAKIKTAVFMLSRVITTVISFILALIFVLILRPF